jgi:hypothetical protein
MDKREDVVAILGRRVLRTPMAQGLNAPEDRQSYRVIATCRSPEWAEALSRSLNITCLTDN